MSSLGERFRAWLGSVQFAVTATAIAVALAAGLLVAEQTPSGSDPLFVVMLTGIAVPNIYDEQWELGFERRLAGVAWAAVAALGIAACYLAFATGLRTVVGETTASITAFVTAWFLGIVVARAASRVYAQ